MKRKLEVVQSKEPEKIKELNNEKKYLMEKMSILEKSNQELTSKISAGAISSGLAASQLALFNTPLGFEDLREQNLAKVDNFSNKVSNGKVTFRFDLMNNQQGDNKLSGFITIIQYHSQGINLYPSINLNKDAPFIQYSKGESFYVSRFRPVIAEFTIPQNSTSVWYKVFLFNRTGNLIYMNSTQEYPLK